MIVLIALEFNHTILGVLHRGLSVVQVRAVVLIAPLAVLRKFIVIEIGEADATLLLALPAATLALGGGCGSSLGITHIIIGALVVFLGPSNFGRIAKTLRLHLSRRSGAKQKTRPHRCAGLQALSFIRKIPAARLSAVGRTRDRPS